jgi:hypothetical protein
LPALPVEAVLVVVSADAAAFKVALVASRAAAWAAATVVALPVADVLKSMSPT